MELKDTISKNEGILISITCIMKSTKVQTLSTIYTDIIHCTDIIVCNTHHVKYGRFHSTQAAEQSRSRTEI